MPEVNETMIYEMAFRMRLYLASSLLEDTHNNDLNERESLLLELVGTKGGMSISEICSFYPNMRLGVAKLIHLWLLP
jgi:hypothetical protein